MANKQTAVEFLIDNIYLLNSLKWNDIIDQAKQMEKEQIINAYEYGNTDREFGIYLEAEQFFNKTYGK